MQLITASIKAAPPAPRLSVGLARTAGEVREAQRLRHRVFFEATGRCTVAGEGLDRDEYDDYCEHLIVRDELCGEVVGTYRLLSPSAARRIGRYYSEGEFDLKPLEGLRHRMVEAGRACVHPDYRGGAVIALLWSGLAAFIARENCEYLVGCASISLADGGANAIAVCTQLQDRFLAPEGMRVNPILPLPLQQSAQLQATVPVIPPLIKGYLRSGAWVGGAPAWDREFQTADLFMMLPLAKLERRYARHYLGKDETLQ